MNKKNTKLIALLSITIFVFVIVIGIVLVKKFAPNNSMMSLSGYFHTNKTQVKVIIGDKICDTPAIKKGKRIYLDFEQVQDQLNSRFYWDANENKLLYTTSTAVITTEPGWKGYYKNNSKVSEKYQIVIVNATKVYVALDYVKEFTALKYQEYSNPARIVITNEFNKKISYCKTNAETKLRFAPGIKSVGLVDLKEKETLRLIEKENQDTGFCKVMNQSGVIGYVKGKDVEKPYQAMNTTQFKEEQYSHILKNGKINLVWHQVTNQSANAKLLNLLSNTKGVNVVSPTWFGTSDNYGSISSLASDDYVTKAHQNGVEVWGLCNDFSPKMKIGKVLGYTSRRQKLAKNLVAEAIRYSLDGLNIDFENIKKESKQDYIQFIREIGIMCRNNGIVLSIDNYPIRAYNQYYNRMEQAKVADYIITMAYDEYYSGSKEAGPVSSIGYVREATTSILKQVPAKQAIIALPFYSRHWKEQSKDGAVKLTSEACSMNYAQEILKDSKVNEVWNKETGMNYLEYRKDNAIHKMWIEDINSLDLKMKEVSNKNVAGVAFWKLGMENKNVWDMIQKYNQ